VDASNRVPLKVTANTRRVALRWPRNIVVTRIIEEFDAPITGTSANISGFPSCASGEQVMKQLGTRLPLILDSGETKATLPSTIVELMDDAWRIGREGAVSSAEIEAALE
jgi:L-threonylcarbamoyladenylate synthase